MGIGVEGGFSTGIKYDIVKTHMLAVVTPGGLQYFELSDSQIPEFVINICTAIIEHCGIKSTLQVDSWDANQDISESKYASTLEQLNNGIKISNDPKTWVCEKSGAKENLWLNLSTGYIGGGRKFWDGSGGSGAALEHYINTGRRFPLCVKLGTITSQGGDVWSYSEDEDTLVKDPLLAQHLSRECKLPTYIPTYLPCWMLYIRQYPVLLHELFLSHLMFFHYCIFVICLLPYQIGELTSCD